MERSTGDQLWWVLTWIITFFWCLFLCASCAQNQPTYQHVQTIDQLTLVDLAGEPVSPNELAEFVVVFLEQWEKLGLGDQDVVARSMKIDPIVVYFPPTDVISCPHATGGYQYGLCTGLSQTGRTSVFVARPNNEPVGCGSLAHELTHVFLSRLNNHSDPNHTKAIWKFGGIEDQVKIRLGCNLKPDLRVWR